MKRNKTIRPSPNRSEQRALPDPFDLALVEYYRARPDMSRYRRLVELGAATGDPLALYAVATWYLLGSRQLGVRRNAKVAVRLLTKASQTLNRAMYDLAVCKSRGEGTRFDPSGAYRLFSAAAGLGSLAALIEQARCLRDGFGVAKNARLAARIEGKVRKLNLSLGAIGASTGSRIPTRRAR